MTDTNDPGIGSPSSRPHVRNLQRRYKVNRGNLLLFMERLARELGSDEAASTLVLVGDERMRALNRLFRGYDRATDVLSFPAEQTDFPGSEPYLGDIVISVETAQKQALRRGSHLNRELRVLALHGFLHLLGYDHETDSGEMRRIEYRLRRKLEITNPRPQKKRTVSSVKKTRKK